MKIEYRELNATQKNKARDMAKFLEKKLHLGISKATNYQHNVVVVFDYNKCKFIATKKEVN